MKAHEILQAGAKHLEDRASTYDKPQGERSMTKVVSMFNILAETNITVEQGWLFMTLLKMVRTQQGQFKMDSYEDLSAYAALAGEEAEQQRKPQSNPVAKTITSYTANHSVSWVQNCENCANSLGNLRACNHILTCGPELILWREKAAAS